MGTFTLASASQLESIQSRVTPSARRDAFYNNATLIITCSGSYDAEWATAQAAEDANVPVPAVGAHTHRRYDIVSEFAQLSNADITTNLNASTSYQLVPLGGSFLNQGSSFTQTGDSIVCNFDGLVRVCGNVYVTTTTVQRLALDCRVHRGGSPVGSIFNSGYIRRSSGHNEAGTPLSAQIFSVSDGDLIDIRARRAANSGTGVMVSGSSHLLVERL